MNAKCAVFATEDSRGKIIDIVTLKRSQPSGSLESRISIGRHCEIRYGNSGEGLVKVNSDKQLKQWQ